MNTSDDFETGNDRLKSWEVPDQYFTELEDRVIQEWRSSKPKTKEVSLLRWLWIPVGVAASFLLFFFPSNTEVGDMELLFNNEELAYYYMYTTEESEVDDLWYDFSDIEIEDVEAWLASEEFDLEILNELY